MSDCRETARGGARGVNGAAYIYIYGSLMECLGGAVGLWIYDSHVGMFMTSKQCGWSCGWFYVGVVYRG